MKISSEFLYEYLAPDWSIEKDGNQKELSDLRFPRFFSAVKPEAGGMYFADYSEMIENCSYDRNSEKNKSVFMIVPAFRMRLLDSLQRNMIL